MEKINTLWVYKELAHSLANAVKSKQDPEDRLESLCQKLGVRSQHRQAPNQESGTLYGIYDTYGVYEPKDTQLFLVQFFDDLIALGYYDGKTTHTAMIDFETGHIQFDEMPDPSQNKPPPPRNNFGP